jgi:SAM-dependent methyltransferase
MTQTLPGQRIEYPTWIRSRRIVLSWAIGSAVVVVAIATGLVWPPAFAGALVALPILYIALVITMTSYRLGPGGGGVQRQIHQLLVEGVGLSGPLLDIGCGSGELLIRCAQGGEKIAPEDLVGLDYWGDDWQYSPQQAENNARIEGFPNLRFVRGTASRLPFADGGFGRVVSALTFHEVRDATDKTVSLQEALRVLAPGGRFALVDLFDDVRIYGGRGRVLAAVEEAGGVVDTCSPLSELVALRWPLTMGQALKYAVVLVGTKEL